MVGLIDLSGLGAGIAVTTFSRQVLDNPDDDPLTRPSVLLGIGLGTAALAWENYSGRGPVPLVPMGRTGEKFIHDFGIAASATGAMSLASPKGPQASSFTLTTLDR